MKFSIVTPVYKGEKYIKETIESVLSQKETLRLNILLLMVDLQIKQLK